MPPITLTDKSMRNVFMKVHDAKYVIEKYRIYPSTYYISAGHSITALILFPE